MKIQRLAALSVAFALLISFAGCAAPENGGGQAEQDLSVCDDLFHRDRSLLSPVLPHILLRQTSA